MWQLNTDTYCAQSRLTLVQQQSMGLLQARQRLLQSLCSYLCNTVQHLAQRKNMEAQAHECPRPSPSMSSKLRLLLQETSPSLFIIVVPQMRVDHSSCVHQAVLDLLASNASCASLCVKQEIACLRACTCDCLPCKKRHDNAPPEITW